MEVPGIQQFRLYRARLDEQRSHLQRLETRVAELERQLRMTNESLSRAWETTDA